MDDRGTYEFVGKTTEEAIKSASLELNIPEEELDIDIIEPGSAGIFGLVGTKKAKIKVIFNSSDKSETPRKEDGDSKSVTTSSMEKETDSQDLNTAKDILERILELIPAEEVTVTAEKIDGKLNLNMTGDTYGLLIGRKGRTLDALQYLVNRAVNKALDKRIRVVIDSENYRQRRIKSLTQLALKMGDKVKKAQKPMTTNLLNSHDRRIVHLTLKEDTDLDTSSRGDGMLKKVLIIPQKAAN